MVSQLDSRYARSRFELGNILQQQTDFLSACDAYRAALEMDPTHVGARCGLGRVLKSIGELDAAAEAFREVLRLAPEHADARYNLGQVLWTKSEDIGPRAACQTTLDIDLEDR